MRRKLEKATLKLRVCAWGGVAFMSIKGGTTPAMAAEDAVVEALTRMSSWNDDNECVRPDGSTRQASCGDFESDAPTFQTVGIVAAIARAGTVVGRLLAGDVTEQLVADTASSRGSKLTGCNAGLMSIACRGSF